MKRFLKITLIGLTFCLFHNLVSAQRVAGYMGKRFFVGIPISYMPNIYSFVNPEASINYNGKEKFYMVNAPKIGASFGFVSSNLRSLVLDVDVQNIGVTHDKYVSLNYNATPLNYDYGKSTLVSFKLRVQNAFQHCAPIGGYKGITLGVTSFSNSYINLKGDEIAAENEIDFSIGYAGGLRRVYKDRFVIDLGLEYNMFIKAIGNVFDFEGIDRLPEESVGRNAINKNGLNSILVCRAAVYVLL